MKILTYGLDSWFIIVNYVLFLYFWMMYRPIYRLGMKLLRRKNDKLD